MFVGKHTQMRQRLSTGLASIVVSIIAIVVFAGWLIWEANRDTAAPMNEKSVIAMLVPERTNDLHEMRSKDGQLLQGNL